MRIYSKYISQKVASSFIYCICAILSVVWLTRSNDILQLIINNGIGLSNFFTFSLLAFPEILFNAIPIATFIAIISIFIKLRQSSEIFALRNGGLSDYDLAKPIITIVTAIAILHLLIATYFLPLSKKIITRKINKFNEKVGSFIIEDRVFIHPTANITIYTEKKIKLGMLSNIFMSDKRIADKDVVMFAKKGNFVIIDDHTYLHLFDGKRQILTPEGYTSMDFDFFSVNVELPKKAKLVREKAMDEMNLWELISTYKKGDNNLVEVYNRFSMPIINYIVALLALALILKHYKGPHSSLWTVTSYVANLAIVVCFIVLTRLAINNYKYCFLSLLLITVLSAALYRRYSERDINRR